MAEVLMVLAPSAFRDEEYAEPRKVLEGHGATVVTASVAAGSCRGMLGMTAQAELSLSQAATRAWDAVVFVGGGGSTVFFDDPAAHALAAEALGRGAVLGAICIAPSTLARAGLLRGVAPRPFTPSARTWWPGAPCGPASP